MRRFGMVLCALALLCQMLVFPVAAEPVADTATDTVGTIAADSATSESGNYEQYVQNNPGESASAVVEVNAATAVQKDATVTVKDNGLLFSNQTGKATWNVEIPATGWYAVAFTYSGVEGGSSDMELGLEIDGKYPYSEAERFVLPRIWVDDGDTRQDSNGNQFAPEQKEDYSIQKKPLRDVNGFVSDDLCVYLTAGSHTVTLNSFGEAIMLYSIHFDVPQVILSLEDQLKKWEAEGVTYYDGDELVVEGEGTADPAINPNDIVSKTDRSVIGQSDNSNPGVIPSNAYIRQLNFIGGANWSMTDEAITWKVVAPKAGIYKVGFHFRQNYLVNATSYRSLKVNGVHQYKEQAALAFYYKNNWQFNDKLLTGGETVLVYLKEGENTVTLTVTLGEMDAFSAKMENITLRLGDMYREIIAIIGETPDANRRYELFKRIPDLEERMTQLHAEMEAMIEERSDAKGNIDDIAALLQKMNVVLEKMLKKQYQAQNYKSNYYDCYSSLSAQLQEMKNMALDLDCMVFAAPEKEYVRTTSNFGKKFVFGVERFIASFMLDYNTAAGVGGENATPLTIWVNWSRDQTLVLNSLINGHFSAENPDVSVTVRMTNASLLQGIMSNNAPDCSLSDSRTTPVNLAMRGALVDLSKFEDYDEVSKWFVKGADAPYRYNGGVYGLPSTQQFYMMFYRTDIFEQYGLVDENGVAKPPKTWDEFIEYASILMLNNMEVGLPYTELTDIGQVNGGVASLNIFPTLLLQEGLSLYNDKDNPTGTSFAEVDTMRVFQEWTDYYTKYNLPKTYSFFNRFRIGLVPMAIQAYGQYSALSAAAPEIKGRWEMAEIPGTPVVDENGTPVLDANGNQVINNNQAGFGSACMILEQSENPEAAWRLLKWWMRADTQRRYALDIESILGVAGRYSSANVEATTGLDWGKSASDILLSQWNKVEEIEEIPGGYYVSRAVDQAFWNVLTMSENPKDMMKKWGEVADVEIQTKINQYKDDRKEDKE